MFSIPRITEKVLLLSIVFFAIFFALFNIDKIPPGLSYDQLRFVLGPEYILEGLVSNVSFRQYFLHFIQLGYFAAFLAKTLRFIGDFQTLVLVPRIISGIFFVLSTVTWFYILKELKLTMFGKIIFFLIFIPSGYFILFSKYVPLVAGYLFFSSLFIYTILKIYTTTKHRLIYFYLAGIFAIAATYTHVISIFFTVLFGGFFFIFAKIVGYSWVRHVFQTLRRYPVRIIFLIIITIIGLGFAIFPFIEGRFVSDQSLVSRDAFSILYYFQFGEFQTAIMSAVQRIFAYLNPIVLVVSKNFATYDREVGATEWLDLKNPDINQWLITNLSPFGIITIFIYIGVFYLIPKMWAKENKLKYLTFTSLFLSYIFLPIIPNFDNPSIAKTMPALLFIPLGLSIMSENIIEILSGTIRKMIYGLIFASVLINGLYNISYMYSNEYQVTEHAKFEYTMLDAVNYMKSEASLVRMRIYYRDPKWWNGHTYLQYFFGPHILNRVVNIEDSEYFKTVSPMPHEDSFFILREKDDFDTVITKFPKSKTRIITDKSGKNTLYVIYIPAENIDATPNKGEFCYVVDPGNLVFYRPSEKPSYETEAEFLIPGVSFYADPDLTDRFLISRPILTKNSRVYSEFNPQKLSLEIDRKTITKFTIHGMVAIENNQFFLKPTNESPSQISTELDLTFPKTYKLSFNSIADPLVSLVVKITNNANSEVVLYRELPAGTFENKNNTLIFGTSGNNKYTLDIIALYQGIVLTSEKHPAVVTLSNINVAKVSETNEFKSFFGEISQFPSENTKSFSLWNSSFLSRTMAPIMQSRDVLVCNFPYSSFITSNVELDKGNINGSVWGGQLQKVPSTPQVTVFESSWMYALILGIIYTVIGVPTVLFLAHLSKDR